MLNELPDVIDAHMFGFSTHRNCLPLWALYFLSIKLFEEIILANRLDLQQMLMDGKFAPEYSAYKYMVHPANVLPELLYITQITQER